ncbi:hypothetical protein ACIBG8_28655 [Nonomuraea sp. NPDC050556]|uniref:hypothetical protein n=1 Tax=Nonomuraea sp. NPDC050556 TaxID=3364369 RepID=UPI0037A5BC69
MILLVAACTACGITTTPVIGAGEPARGFIQGTRLYFVQDDRLVSVGRPEGPLSAGEAVALLRDGPTSKERDRSFDTRIPKNMAVRVTDDGFTMDKGVSMLDGGKWLPAVVSLSRVATGQVVCTIAAATAAKRGVEVNDVRVTIPDKRQVHCRDYE